MYFEGPGKAIGAQALRRKFGGDFELLLPGARLHEPAADGTPPIATAHVACVLAVFSTVLTPAHMARLELDTEFVSPRTLAVAFPLLWESLQEWAWRVCVGWRNSRFAGAV